MEPHEATDHEVSTQNNYRIHGLTIRSAMELPELMAAPAEAEADVSIELGETPVRLSPLNVEGPLWQVGDGVLLLSVPGAARYLVAGGKRVVVDPEPDASPGDIRLYLLGVALGMLLHQRGLLALHASAAEIHGRAVAFVGHSGAGKSTLVAHLRKRGHRMVGDDLLAVRLGEDVRPYAYPSFARVKLWADALKHIHHAPEDLIRDHSRLEKFHLPIAEDMADSGLPLSHVFVLEENRVDREILLEPLSGADAVHALTSNAYRPHLVKALGLKGALFRHCSQVAKCVRVIRLSRPKNIERMEAVLDALEAACKTPA